MVDVADGWADLPERSAWPDEWVTDELQVLQRRRAMDAAAEAELILVLAGHRPVRTDPQEAAARRPGWTADGEPEISECSWRSCRRSSTSAAGRRRTGSVER